MPILKPATLLGCLATIPLWCSNLVSAKPAPTAVKLTFAHGPEVLLNDGWYEGNKDAYGNGVRDNYPDYKAGDRIAPGEVVEDAALHLNATGTGRWKLIFPRQIKVWLMINGKPRQVMSGVFSGAVALPRTVKLQIDGIETGEGIRIAALLQLATGGKATAVAGFTVFSSGGFSVTGVGESAVSKAAREREERRLALWPPCRTTDWAAGEARLLTTGHQRLAAPGGNGLSRVEIASPTFGSIVSILPALAGTAEPATGRPQIKTVRFSLGRRALDSASYEYWTGTKWEASYGPPNFTAHLQGNHWTSVSPLPSGVNLPSGFYGIEVRAYDALNQWGYERSTFVVDRTPQLAVTSPADRSRVPTFAAFEGSMNPRDATNPVVGVQVRLSRILPETGYGFWDGTDWTHEAAAPLTCVIAGAGWSLHERLPPAPTLQEGTYQLDVAAVCEDGSRVCTDSSFLVWRRPTITTATPAGPLTNLRSVAGTVELVPGGTPVTGVQVLLACNNERSRRYWNGTSWTREPAMLPATYAPPTAPDGKGLWHLEQGWPEHASLPDGRYSLLLKAYNGDAEVALAWSGFEIYRGPKVTITWPSQGATVAALDADQPVQGTAEPGVSGAAIVSVGLSLTRFKPVGGAESWSGTQWVAVPAQLKPLQTIWAPAAAGAAGTWRRKVGWPPILPSGGGYYLTASVTDADGKMHSTTVSFREHH